MAAYVIANLAIRDQDAYAEYAKQVPETISRWGGRFIVRGGSLATLDGDWQPKRLVVIEFPNLETARNWYRSEEYQAVLPIRLANADGGAVLVEGYGPD